MQIWVMRQPVYSNIERRTSGGLNGAYLAKRAPGGCRHLHAGKSWRRAPEMDGAVHLILP